MCGEATKERKEEGGKSVSGCCPENFKEMFRNMSACCADRADLSGCREIVANMKAGCCGPENAGEKK